MKTVGSVKHKLQQVVFRHRKKLVRELTREIPANCKYHRLVEVGLGVETEICLFGADDPTTWENRDCRAKCGTFEPKATKEQIKARFQEEMGGDLAVIAVKYPDTAALLWVLDGDAETIDGAVEEESEDEMSLIPLLDVFPFTSQDIKKGMIPLAMEFPVEPVLAPYLVSSSKATVWVKKASKKGSFIRAAVRGLGEQGVGAFFREVVQQVWELSLEAEWGSAHPFSRDGITNVIQYVESQGFEEVDVLVHPETKSHPEMPEIPIAGMSATTALVETEWMLPKAVVVVPRNREYLGFAGMLSKTSLISVVHNPSRGIGIAMSG